MPATAESKPLASTLPATRISPLSGPTAESVSWPGSWSTANKRSRPSNATSAAPSSASIRLSICQAAASRCDGSPLALPSITTRIAAKLPVTWSSAVLPEVGARSTMSTACTFAGASRSASRRSEAASCGAHLAAMSLKPSSALASRSSVTCPRGCDDNSSIRPFISSLAPAKSPTERRSICNFPASNLTWALTACASTPAKVALPMSRASVPSCGSAIPSPPIADLAKVESASRSSSAARSSASSRAGRLPSGQL